MRISDHSFMKKNAKLFYVPPWIYCVCVSGLSLMMGAELTQGYGHAAGAV